MIIVIFVLFQAKFELAKPAVVLVGGLKYKKDFIAFAKKETLGFFFGYCDGSLD
jgi:hypothetical protein